MFVVYLILTFFALIGFVVFVVIDNSYNGKVNGHSKHVVFLGLDGLSSRNLDRAKTPNINFIKNNFEEKYS